MAQIVDYLKVAALAGGVGGAKLAHGLAQCLLPEKLTVIVNTGDDFKHLGLYICPDLDTVCYTLAGINNPATGWGREGETWHAMQNIAALGGPDWFNLGDKDLATHLERTRRLHAGQTLSQITNDFCRAWGNKACILPMSDDPVQTWVETDRGELIFQEYFVRYQCQPIVKGFSFQGAEQAKPAPGVIDALTEADLIIICPSNPWVSIQPILSVAGIKQAMERKIVIAVSPLIAGQALKGPAAKMYHEMGIEPSAYAVAQHYHTLISGFILDNSDKILAAEIEVIGIHPYVTDIVMHSIADRARLAWETIQFGEELLSSRKSRR
ncbi:MAG: 2-phospho-L-lactate transferase [Chloroflexi bacterium]|nr:2-phospho-L-lactate transferase [Chloroflexota bacterium]